MGDLYAANLDKTTPFSFFIFHTLIVLEITIQVGSQHCKGTKRF